jgi:hypothetical protein
MQLDGDTATSTATRVWVQAIDRSLVRADQTVSIEAYGKNVIVTLPGLSDGAFVVSRLNRREMACDIVLRIGAELSFRLADGVSGRISVGPDGVSFDPLEMSSVIACHGCGHGGHRAAGS